jgi:hypothetical protein
MKKKSVLSVLCWVFLLLLPSIVTASQSDTEPSEYFETLNQSIMRPGMDVIKGWMEEAKASREAYIDPNIANVLDEQRLNSMATQINLLTHLQYTPSERDQKSCGNCWNWAGQGVLGIALDVSKGVKDRLSTQFVNSCKTDRYACCGGWLQDFAGWYALQQIAVPWSNANASFADGSAQCQDNNSSLSCSQITATPNYAISSIEAVTIDTSGGKSQAIANIKNVLAQNKAVWFGFFLPNQADWNQFLTFWGNQSESDLWSFDFSQGHQWTSDGGGHAVLLVGYNEDVAEPYWIILNSWGAPTGRPNGLFHMKMDMDYGLTHLDGSKQEQGLYFQTLNVQFAGGSSGGCSYSVYPTSERFNSNGGNGSMAVNVSSASCNWTVSKSADWITNVSSSSGSGSGTITYQVSPNSGLQERKGTLTVQGKTLTITQNGAVTESNLLRNGGFEDGALNTAWTETGAYEIINRAPCFSMGAAECAHDGEWIAWLGGYDYAEDVIYQAVTIPSSTVLATLRFWYAIDTWDYLDSAYDTLSVLVYNGQWHTVMQLSNLNWTYDWTQSTDIDLSAFIGQNITIAFVALLDHDFSTNFYIDDVKLISGTAAQSISPVPDIRVNGGDGPLAISSGTPVSITVGLNPGSYSGHSADWWLAESLPSGGYNYFNLSAGGFVAGLSPTHSGPLFSLGQTQLLNGYYLSAGKHNFYFAVDMNMNGSLDMNAIYYDYVTVNVTSP